MAVTPPAGPEAFGSTVQVVIYLGTPCRAATDAYVEMPELDAHGRADEEGRVVLTEIPPGTHRLLVWSAGYGLIEATIDVSEMREITVLVDLEGGRISQPCCLRRGGSADLSRGKRSRTSTGM
jgi:hypothetical protein